MRTCASLCRSRSRGFFSFLGALLSRSVRFRFSTRGFGFCARPKTREEASPDLRAHPSVSAMAESTSATKVQLHLYDLSQGMARVMSAQLLGKQIEGVWHTGIVAFGEEWYFGGGIQRGAPGFTYFGRPLQVLDLGETHLPRELFQEFLVDIAPRFTMQTYNLLRHNCNNFSDTVAEFLLGTGIPSHILSLPDEVLSTPFGLQLMPMISMMDTQMRMASEGNSGGGFGNGGGFTAQSTQPTVPTPRAVPVERAVPAPAPAKPPVVSPASAREASAAAAETRAADGKQELEAAIKAEFTKLVAQGMSPNEAATAAVRAARGEDVRGEGSK